MAIGDRIMIRINSIQESFEDRAGRLSLKLSRLPGVTARFTPAFTKLLTKRFTCDLPMVYLLVHTRFTLPLHTIHLHFTRTSRALHAHLAPFNA